MTKYNNFYRSFIQSIDAIDYCIDKNYVIPSLCLIYSGIDSIAWVASGDIGVKDRFMKFVDDHMYVEKPLMPKSIDLYAARCSILHTMTHESRLSNEGVASLVSYSYGNVDNAPLQKSIDILRPGEIVTVHISDLRESFRLGIAHFMENEGMNEECKARMKKHYALVMPEDLERFNAHHNA